MRALVKTGATSWLRAGTVNTKPLSLKMKSTSAPQRPLSTANATSCEIAIGELPPRPDAVIEDLVDDLEALERFASERKDIPGDRAVAMTASLAEAIGRLNVIAERISASADNAPLRAAS